MGFSK
ncbi:hypothetical protein VCHC17A1_3937A, partial [Vibrio cholerae HC-17A1]